MANIQCQRSKWAFGTAEKNGYLVAKTSRTTCGTWQCPACRIDRVRTIRRVIQDVIIPGKWKMLTVTIGNNITLQSAWAKYSYMLKHMLLSIKRNNGEFQYIAITEPQPGRHYPHAHILISKNLSATTLHQCVRGAGFGHVMQLVTIDSAAVGFYISKYLTKPWDSPVAESLRKRYAVRYIRTSRDIRITERRESEVEHHGLAVSAFAAGYAVRNALGKVRPERGEKIATSIGARSITHVWNAAHPAA